MFGKQESNEFRIPAELAALEKQLAGLRAAPVRVDRDRVMFEAGRAAGARIEERGSRSESLLRSRFWPMATATMTAATVLLAAMLLWPTAWRGVGAKPPAMEVVATANIAAQVANPVAAYPVTWTGYDRTPPGYLGIRYVALTRGVDASRTNSPLDGTIPLRQCCRRMHRRCCKNCCRRPRKRASKNRHEPRTKCDLAILPSVVAEPSFFWRYLPAGRQRHGAR